MARRSGRLSGTGQSAVTHKRALSGNASNDTPPKRPKQRRTTPSKSQYFANDAIQPESDERDQDAMITSSEDSAVSAFEEDAGNSGSSGVEDEIESDDADETPRRKTPAKGEAASTEAKDSQLWKAGVKTGLGPGKQLIIKKPKARAAGATPYMDETLHPNTLLFLDDLKANNNREWLKMHDSDFRASESDFHRFVEATTQKLTAIDDTIPELPVKDVVFRIYRDVRFSKDPTPYKILMGLRSRSGRKGPYAAYYLQVGGPNQKSFCGGGLWQPEAAPTAAMRRAIDQDPRRLKDVLLDDRLRTEFLGGAAKSDTKVVEAFVKGNRENALKTKPKGYDSDHPDIDLLRLRNYTIGRDLAKEDVLGPKGADRIAELLACISPFVAYLNSVVMPDDSNDSEDDEDESEESE